VAVDPELFDFIADAIRYSIESDGAFDVTVGPLMKTWGFFEGDGRVPSSNELDAARARVGYRHLVLDRAAHTIRFDGPGVSIDLGGIAKGYAVDRVAALLRHRGVEAALISAGGSSVFALGAPPGETAWRVDVQDPVAASNVAFSLRLKDRALSVSGSSEKSFEANGVRYGHVMDPRTGRPVPGILSVVVLTPDATSGDALDNALFVLGPAGGQALLRTERDSEAFFFLPDGASWRMVKVEGPTSRSSR
jgi:thiamine biosynthesis lipoprotein